MHGHGQGVRLRERAYLEHVAHEDRLERDREQEREQAHLAPVAEEAHARDRVEGLDPEGHAVGGRHGLLHGERRHARRESCGERRRAVRPAQPAGQPAREEDARGEAAVDEGKEQARRLRELAGVVAVRIAKRSARREEEEADDKLGDEGARHDERDGGHDRDERVGKQRDCKGEQQNRLAPDGVGQRTDERREQNLCQSGKRRHRGEQRRGLRRSQRLDEARCGRQRDDGHTQNKHGRNRLQRLLWTRRCCSCGCGDNGAAAEFDGSRGKWSAEAFIRRQGQRS